MTGLNAYLPPDDLPAGEAFLPDRILEVSRPGPAQSAIARAPAVALTSASLTLAQIAVIVTDKNLNPLDDGVEYIIKTDKGVLDKMNAWSVERPAPFLPCDGFGWRRRTVG